MIDFLGLLYHIATANTFDTLVVLLIGGFLVYMLWVGVSAIFSAKTTNNQRVHGHTLRFASRRRH